MKPRIITDPIIEFNNVCFSYRSKIVLEDISFQIQKGEKVVFLGANGSGKSTLLKILDGLTYPYSGTFYLSGININEKYLSQKDNEFDFRKKVGFVFQDSDVQLFSSTVFDEVAFAPLHMGLSYEQVVRKTEKALKIMDIKHLSERVPFQLSGGEKKKVAIASVLSYEPSVWLFDEPTAGLDPRSQSLLIDFIYDLKQADNTVITATHDLSILNEIADRVIVLSENHRIVADGIPDIVLKDLKFLKKHNLLHEHIHKHGRRAHGHVHMHNVNHTHK
jgi:cobalt/nickel transport system ATP-binding protein